ncbi:TonB-dependent receptor [Neisseriaceae bacterium B1]
MNFTLKTLPVILLTTFSSTAWAETETAPTEDFSVSLPTIKVEVQADTAATKGYITYDEAAASRTGLTVKETPQAIDIINIQKNKNYGTNDLSSILEGNAGIDATYDMRGESINIRGFQADGNDIYRNGVRESGQVRRSTTNIERVEILKGPSSVLYGRSNGGGVINMVSKTANFKTSHNIGLLYGSYGTRNVNVDLNQKINDNWAVRLVAEAARVNSFRDGADSDNLMLAPSVRYRNGNLTWVGEYLYDNIERTPDRNPSKAEYDKMGISYRQSFAHSNDTVKDKLQVWRSNLNYQFNDQWNAEWQLAYRKADQDFDHFYGGTFNPTTRLLKQNYAWQTTENTTLSNTITLNGDFNIGRFHNHLTMGYDYTRERRNPTLGYKGSFSGSMNPYDSRTWQPSGRLVEKTTENEHKVDTHALFFNNVFSVLPNLKIATGGRYERFQFSSRNVLKDQQSEYKKGFFNPNVGLVWDITPHHSVYASYSKSFTPYGSTSYISIDSASNSNTFNITPETNRQFEIGLKSNWFDNKLSSTIAVYQMERYNRRYRPDAQNNPYFWATRGKERSRGIELSVIGQIMPKWYVRSSLGWLDSEIMSDEQYPALVGRELNNTARVQGNLFVRHVPNERLFFETGVTGSGKRYGYTTRGSSVSFGEIAGFARMDALVGYTHKNWNATLAVNNVLNQKYWRSDSMPGNPRHFTLRVNYRF